MTTSSIQRSLIPAACIAGTLFAISTAPLAMYRSEVVAVELQNRPFFAAEIRDLAGPYLGLAGLISVSLGVSVMGFSGWRQASRKSEAAESKLSGLQRDLLAQQSELEEIKFSQSRLRSQNLDTFLEPQTSLEALNQQVPHRAPLAAIPNHIPAPIAPVPQAVTAPKPQVVPIGHSEAIPYVSYVSLTDRPLDSAATPVNAVKDKAMMALAAAQSYASYARSSNPMDAGEGDDQAAGVPQLDQLLGQLQQLASQVEELRTTSSKGLAA